MSAPTDPITVVIPVHNASHLLDRVVAWRAYLDKCGRSYDLLVVDDGSTDGTAEKLPGREPRACLLRHDTRRGFGACLRTALAEARYPLFFYTALDYPYTPSDLRKLLDRIDLRDEILGRKPDLISGCRTGIPTPGLVRWGGFAWRLLWRLFAGMPMTEPTPWHGWGELWYRTRASWVYGVPLADINSCFKLFRTAFLKRFPIQSDGDFVHTELVAKATFLKSIMDEVPLTPKPDPLPSRGDVRHDCKRVLRAPCFAHEPPPSVGLPPAPHAPAPAVLDAPGSPSPVS